MVVPPPTYRKRRGYKAIPLSLPHNPDEAESEGANTVPEKRNGSTDGGDDSDNNNDSVMKKASVRKLIERYFYQLLEGCGNRSCRNRHCKSSGQVPTMTPNQAAARALQLFSQDAKLCAVTVEAVAAKESRDQQASHRKHSIDDGNPSNDDIHRHVSTPSSSIHVLTSPSTDGVGACQRPAHKTTARTGEAGGNKSGPDDEGLRLALDEDMLRTALKQGIANESLSKLISMLGVGFTSVENICQSFQVREKAPLDHILDRAKQIKRSDNLKTLTKEELRTLEDDQDKDEDSCAERAEEAAAREPHHSTVDFASLRRIFGQIFTLHESTSFKVEPIFEVLNNVLDTIAFCLPIDLQCTRDHDSIENIITAIVIIFDVMCLAPCEFLDTVMVKMCESIVHLPRWAQARVAWIWSVHCKEHLRVLLESLQQIISCQAVKISCQDSNTIDTNDTIKYATITMKVLYYANILAGDYEKTRAREEKLDPGTFTLDFEDMQESYETTTTLASESSDDETGPDGRRVPMFGEDPLAAQLQVSVMDSRVPLIPFAEFYNELLGESLEMDQDYLNYRSWRLLQDQPSDERAEALSSGKISFMLYPFVLTPAKKALSMYFHSRIMMYSEGRINILHTHFSGQPANPFLKLRVRRDHLIEDALIELEMIALGNPKDLKKQLVVEFVGEQGVDEGGVSKEFFQLIVEAIFNLEYGMFFRHEETDMFWINSMSFENEAQFTLIGIVFGLAIYNNIILAVNFPMVIYRKLMGVKGAFRDLFDWSPNLYRSLLNMLADDESDMEEVYMQSFEITYRDVFGNVLPHELKVNGGQVPVTQATKREFVDLYADFLLNRSIEKQFRAFRKGFQMVMGDESPLNMLFRPEEVELLVCGSKQFDVTQLQKATEYDGGYTADSTIIKDFWDIVYEMPIESQRKLLEFSTGSDRVPVGGLSNLKLMIARNGPDSDRLPTSHTCYNILLLPEYSSKAKLKERLLKAINFSKGFGML